MQEQALPSGKKQSMSPILEAAMLLNKPFDPQYTGKTDDNVPEYAYLLPRSYMENWITWARCQKIQNEHDRDKMNNILDGIWKAYDCKCTSNSNQIKRNGMRPKTKPFSPAPVTCLSICDGYNVLKMGLTSRDIIAVPEPFYDFVRSMHGAQCVSKCKSGYISFQPQLDRNETILQQYEENPDLDNNEFSPCEFRRRMLGPEYFPELPTQSGNCIRLGEKIVEIYPICFSYKLMKKSPTASVDDSTSLGSFNSSRSGKIGNRKARVTPYSEVLEAKAVSSQSGKVWTSRACTIQSFVSNVCKVVCPRSASFCVRLWYKYKHSDATKRGDRYEILHVTSDSTMSIFDWCKGQLYLNEDVDCIVEVRENVTGLWPRADFELVNRISVGDYVDARDSTGKWYESLVREVLPDGVKVHFIGWSTRWDLILPRDHSRGPDSTKFLEPPQPLWTQTNNWRTSLDIGSIVEVREASSGIRKPKWLFGKIVAFDENDSLPHPIRGGADLELFESDVSENARNTPKLPLLLLKRRNQVLVQVEEEKYNVSSNALALASSEQSVIPPFRRWVNLYGEEICESCTHRKSAPGANSSKDKVTTPNKNPAMLQYGHVNDKTSGVVATPSNRGFVRGVPVDPGCVGLTNLGNTCYLNTILQCLIHCPILIRYFIRNEFLSDLNKENPLGSQGRVANAFAEFSADVWSNDYTTVSPKLLKHAIGLFAHQFFNQQQHDAQELCAVLLDGLHEDCNKIKQKPYVDMEINGQHSEARRAIITWQKHIKRHDSIIVDHFQGMHKSHLTCVECSYSSIKFDVYSCISLPVPNVTSNSRRIPLKSCFDEFISSEQLDTDNAWYCPQCKEHVRAKKRINLWTTPDILILHLKRFGSHTDVSNGRRQTRIGSKITSVVDFPIEKLDLTEYVLLPGAENNKKRENIYRLMGVAEHQGGTANSGHYTATARSRGNDLNSVGSWYRFNDGSVGATMADAAITGGAYVLFYERKGATDSNLNRWGGMEEYMHNLGVDPYVEEKDEVDDDGFVQVTRKGSKKKHGTRR